MISANLVFLRHGESQWNLENRFTGWVDVDLSPNGRTEAQKAGGLLKSAGFEFNWAYTSVLKRAIRTLWIALDEMNQMYLPTIKDWRLNERHYGGLQGLNKAETARKYGDEQVHIWRRSYDTPPPELDLTSWELQKKEKVFQTVPPTLFPKRESLKDTLARTLPLWNEQILPQLQQGKKILVVAHGNSLRGLVQNLEGLSPEAVMELNIPTGAPLAYHYNATNHKVLDKTYL